MKPTTQRKPRDPVLPNGLTEQERFAFRSPFDAEYFVRYVEIRRGMDVLWEAVSKPLKMPNRRRREDRELPKAA